MNKLGRTSSISCKRNASASLLHIALRQPALGQRTLLPFYFSGFPARRSAFEGENKSYCWTEDGGSKRGRVFVLYLRCSEICSHWSLSI